MKQAMGAVVALALGLGLAASAQAHGINRQSAVPSPNMQTGSTQQMQQGQLRPQRAATARKFTSKKFTSKRNVRQVQTRLRAEGLYKGRIDGIMGPKTRHAMARAQQHTRTATLGKQRTRAAKAQQRRQKGGQEVGVGSSAPTGNVNQQMMPQTNQTPNNAAGSSMPNQTPNANQQNQKY